MMHCISLNGNFYRVWLGACPGVEGELAKAKLGLDGFAYDLIANGEYPEGEALAHFDLITGARIVRRVADPGYKYDGPGLDAAMIPDDGSDVLAKTVEAWCDEVDAEWARRLSAVGIEFDGFHFPLNDTAQTAYIFQYDEVREGLADHIDAWAVENVNHEIPAAHAAEFKSAVAAGIRSYHIDRVATKKNMRAAASYEAAKTLFDQYMEG